MKVSAYVYLHFRPCEHSLDNYGELVVWIGSSMVLE